MASGGLPSYVTGFNEWSEQDIGPRGVGIFDVVLQTTYNILNKNDDLLWNLMTNSIEAG